MQKKLTSILFIVVMLAGLLAGCTNNATVPSGNDDTDDGTPKFGGQIIFGITGEPTTLNPILSTDSVTDSIIDKINEGLLKTNENLELVGELAESWEVADDGLSITFHLKHDVLWHDGEPFTSADVKFTYDAVMHDDYTGVRKRDFQYVEEVTTPDEYTVVLNLSQPDAALLYKLEIGIIAEHLFANTPIAELNEHENSWNPVGTGPYTFVEYVPGQRAVLAANPNYHEEGPYIEQVIFKVYQDEQVRMAAFENGDIDYIPAIPVDDVDLVKQTMADTANFVETPHNGYYYIGLKQNHPILSDLNVRKAMMYSLDRDTIVDTVFKGYGTVINSHGVPISWAFNPDVNNYDTNLETAIDYLEAAGWTTVGEDGIRMNDAGERLSFVMVSASGNTDKANVIDMVKEQWSQVGIEVVVEYYERSVLFSQYLDQGKFEAYMWGWNLSLDPDCYLQFHSDCAIDENGVLQGFNDVEYKNDTVDQLLEQGRETFDQTERKEIYGQIQQILNEELPYVFLYTTNDVQAMNKKVKNVKWSTLEPIDIHTWYIQ